MILTDFIWFLIDLTRPSIQNNEIQFLIATILSLYHLGIEQGFIQESLLCDLEKGANILDKEEILKQLQQKNISCKDVTFQIFGLSLTSYNVLISLIIIL